MSPRHSFIAAVLFCCVSVAQVAPTTQPGGAKLHETKEFALALPAGWTPIPQVQNNRRPLHAVGDGNGTPAVDETGAPLQVGMSVEHFVGFKKTLAECVKTQKDSVTRAVNLEPVGEPIEKALKLSDGRDAVLLTFQFIKDGRRHSTQLKLIVKGVGDDHWIASGWAVGSKDSKELGPDQPLVAWLARHLETFTLDPAKFDRTKLPPPLSK